MTVRLKKELVFRLYFLTWQAWRSLHKALGAPWAEFREFYSPDRVACLNESVACLRSLAGPGHRCFCFQDGERVFRAGVWQAIFQAIPGVRVLNRFRKKIAFSALEVDFLASMLASFMAVLQHEEKPRELKELIALRMALFDCAHALGGRCGVDGLIGGQEQIEHFWRTDWIKPVYLDDLLRRAGLPIEDALAVQGR